MATDVTVSVGADATELRGGLSKIESSVDRFKSKLNGIGASIATGFGIGTALTALTQIPNMIRIVLDKAGEVADLSDRTAQNAEVIQKVGVVAQNSGISMEKFTKAMETADNKAYEAVKGNKDLAESFKKLKIDPVEFINSDYNIKLQTLAEAWNETGQSTEAYAAMTDIIGTKSVKMFALLNQGPEELRKGMQEASVLSNQEISDLDRLGDTWEILKSRMLVGLSQLFLAFKSVHAELKVFLATMVNAAIHPVDTIVRKGFDKNYEAQMRNKYVEEPETKDKVEASKKQEQRLAARLNNENALRKEAEDLKEERYIKRILESRQKQAEQAERLIKAEEDIYKSRMEFTQKMREETISQQKETLEALEKNFKPTTKDNLERIGGGYANTDYQRTSKMESLQREAINAQKKLIKASEDILKTLKTETFDAARRP